jgi:hypothetical protein
MTPIQAKYHALIREGVQLGIQIFPVGGNIGNISTEADAPHGGKYRVFQHGAIYWKPNLPAVVIKELMYQRWVHLGGVDNVNTGYPIADEQVNPYRSTVIYQAFENGWISHSPTADGTLSTSYSEVGPNFPAASDHFARVYVEMKLSSFIREILARIPLPEHVTVTIQRDFARIKEIIDYTTVENAVKKRVARVYFVLFIDANERDSGTGRIDTSLNISFHIDNAGAPFAKLETLTFSPPREESAAIAVAYAFGVDNTLRELERTMPGTEFSFTLTEEEKVNFGTPYFGGSRYNDVVLLKDAPNRGNVLFFFAPY